MKVENKTWWGYNPLKNDKSGLRGRASVCDGAVSVYPTRVTTGTCLSQHKAAPGLTIHGPLVTRILKKGIRVYIYFDDLLPLFFYCFSCFGLCVICSLFPYIVSVSICYCSSCFGKCMSCLLGTFAGGVLCENCLTLFGPWLKFKKKLVIYFDKRI